MDTVYVGIKGAARAGELSPVVQGSTETVHVIAVKYGDGTAYTLTGKTLSGLWWQRRDTVYAITGTLTVTDAANGVFTWDRSADDVGTPGVLQVQFVITDSDSGESDATFPAALRVEARGEATNVIAGDTIDGGTPADVPIYEFDGGDAEGV